MFIKKSYFVVFFALIMLAVSSFAQTEKKKELENKKKELQKEIDYQNKLLGEVKKNKNRSMVQLAILNNKIARQKDLISTINKEVTIIESSISETEAGIHSKEAELKFLKDDYARILFASYKNRDSYSWLMFLFASANFNQAYQRLKYMQYYTEARKKQAELIEETQRQLYVKKQVLETRKDEQHKSLNEKAKESSQLSKEKINKEIVLSDLQQNEKNIKAEIKKKKEQAEKLKKAIEKIIDDEIRKSNLHAKSNTKKIILTPEEQVLSNNFESNKGKLPWPLTEGVITESFGTHDHPDLPGIKISNNGINIGTNKGANVRAVFNGKVVAVASIGGLDGKVVIVKHGEFLTVYSNMDNCLVKSGETIKTKQTIGKVLTDDNSTTVLHFEIWKGQNMLNPESWIAK